MLSIWMLYIGATHNPNNPTQRARFHFYANLSYFNFAGAAFLFFYYAWKRVPGKKYVKLPPLPTRSG